MSSIQEEILTQNDNQMISRLNSHKIKGVVEILINPCLYFIKQLQDEEAQFNGGLGLNSSNKHTDVVAKKAVLKVRKIKENHMVLLVTLSKRCLEDGHYSLTETVLNTSLSMSLISDELLQQIQHKSKGFSSVFIQRYLSSICDFIKTDIETARFNADKIGEYQDFTCQMFSAWKFLIQSVDKKSGDALSSIFGFAVHIHSIIFKGIYESKITESRMRLLFHFIISSIAQWYSISPLIDALIRLKQAQGINEQVWGMLPQLQAKESLGIYTVRLENMLAELQSKISEDGYDEFVHQLLKLNIERGFIESGQSNPLVSIFESSLENMSHQPSLLKQKIETFKLNDHRGTASHLQESTKKAPIMFDINQKFMVESLNASQVDDMDDIHSHQAMHMIRADTASPDQKREVRGRDGQLFILPSRVPALNKLDASLNSEMYDGNTNTQQNQFIQSEDAVEDVRDGQNLIKIIADDGLSIRSSLSNESVGGLRIALGHKPNITAAPNKFMMQQRVQQDYGIDLNL